MKEAMFYSREDSIIVCKLCPHHCRLKEGATGICRTREHGEGKLITTSYGKLCAIHVDPIEKKPLYHFLPGSKSLSIATAGCNLRCKNCQNASISQVSPSTIDSYDLSPAAIVEMALNKECESISYTYTDPVAYYEYMLDVAELAHHHGLKNIMVSAGYINQEPLERLMNYLDGANIDLKAFDEKVYRKLSGIHLQPVLDCILLLHKAGIWVEITHLVIPGWTDNISVFEKMLEWYVSNGLGNVPLHLNRFVPGYQLNNEDATPRALLLKMARIAHQAGLKYIYIGNIGSNDYQDTKCPQCNRVVVHRWAYHVEVISVYECTHCSSVIHGRW